VVDQADVEFIAPGQAVEIQLAQSPGTILPGSITELSEIDLKVIPPEILPGGEVAGLRDESGQVRPLGTWYQAKVDFTPPKVPLLAGQSGKARIQASRLSLGSRLWRWLQQTFRLAAL